MRKSLKLWIISVLPSLISVILIIKGNEIFLPFVLIATLGLGMSMGSWGVEKRISDKLTVAKEVMGDLCSTETPPLASLLGFQKGYIQALYFAVGDKK